MAVAAVVVARDVRQLAQLLRVQRAVGDGDAQHVGVQLQVDAVHQPQRPELRPRSARRRAAARPGRGTARRGRSRSRGRTRRSDTSVSSFRSSIRPAASCNVGRAAAGLLAEILTDGRACGADPLAQPRSARCAPSTSSTSIRLTSTTLLSCIGRLPIASRRSSPALSLRARRASCRAFSAQPAVGVEPDGHRRRSAGWRSAPFMPSSGSELRLTATPCAAASGSDVRNWRRRPLRR